MNKMKMYLQLQERIYTGFGVDLIIVDSPFENKDFAPYVVWELMRKTPVKDIPVAVLNKLALEIEYELNHPTLGSKIYHAFIKFFESYRLRKQVKHNKRSNVLSLNKNNGVSKR